MFITNIEFKTDLIKDIEILQNIILNIRRYMTGLLHREFIYTGRLNRLEKTTNNTFI